jgi:hypothetical protein
MGGSSDGPFFLPPLVVAAPASAPSPTKLRSIPGLKLGKSIQWDCPHKSLENHHPTLHFRMIRTVLTLLAIGLVCANGGRSCQLNLQFSTQTQQNPVLFACLHWATSKRGLSLWMGWQLRFLHRPAFNLPADARLLLLLLDYGCRERDRIPQPGNTERGA